MKFRAASKTGRPDSSTGKVPPPSTGQFSVMPLQVAPVAKACIIRPVGIEPKGLGDLAPWPAESCRGARADQAEKFVGAEREAAFAIHPPGEAQRQAARVRHRLAGKRFDGSGWRTRHGLGRGRNGFGRWLIGCGRFGKRIEQRKLGGRFAGLCGLLIVGSRLRRDRLLDHGRGGCARLHEWL